MKDIAKKSNTLYLLDKYQLSAAKRFGQNFLIDLNTIKKIVQLSKIDQDTCVIEIGPGIGALTEQLARSAQKVICFEIDERLKPVLAESLGEYSNVEIIFQDFLTVDLKNVVEKLREDYRHVSIVANLPYYITSDILEAVIVSEAKLDSIYAMVQKEVAQKLTDPQYHSPLTYMIESIGNIDTKMIVSRHVFMPAPRVDSAIIEILIDRPYQASLTPILKQAFQQKRKTLYNNLKPLFQDQTLEILEKCHIEANKRPAELTIDDYLRLANYDGE